MHSHYLIGFFDLWDKCDTRVLRFMGYYKMGVKEAIKMEACVIEALKPQIKSAASNKWVPSCKN